MPEFAEQTSNFAHIARIASLIGSENHYVISHSFERSIHSSDSGVVRFAESPLVVLTVTLDGPYRRQ